jgi:hypothetical protein
MFWEKKKSSIMCSHLEKTCLPCNSSKISFHIWIFKFWIYTLHNNVHMLNAPYIYVMGSHLDQSCMPHYLPCKTMFICWVHTMLGKYHIKNKSIGSSFQNRFLRIELVLKYFLKKTHFKYPKRISNALKKYLTSFWECWKYNQTISIEYPT